MRKIISLAILMSVSAISNAQIEESVTRTLVDVNGKAPALTKQPKDPYDRPERGLLVCFTERNVQAKILKIDTRIFKQYAEVEVLNGLCKGKKGWVDWNHVSMN